MFAVSEEDIKIYLDEVPSSNRRYSDPDDSDDGTYNYLEELSILGEIYKDQNTKKYGFIF